MGLRDWANRDRPSTDLRTAFEGRKVLQPPKTSGLVDPTGARLQQAPTVAARQAAPSASVIFAVQPPPRPIVYPGMGHAAPPTQRAPIPASNQIVKVDAMYGSTYENLLSTLPDLAEEAGVKAPSFDATRMAGRVPGAAMEKWTPTTRHYTGATDSDERFEGLRAKRDRELLG